MAFEIAVKGIDQAAVIETCRRYIRGEVAGDTLRYAPSTAEFAKEARRQEYRDQCARRPQIPHQPEPEHSDEHRAMMLKRLAEWGKSLGTHQEH